MKIFAIIGLSLFIISGKASAHLTKCDHRHNPDTTITWDCESAVKHGPAHNHTKHNMILLGETEVFASHIVYKEPHNFQVILRLGLDPEAKELYLAARKLHEKDLFIFLLDPMDIKEIASLSVISGKIFHRDANDEEHVILSNVTLSKENFSIFYFDELPLSLKR